MSVQSEIDRISGNVASALSAIAEQGVDVPENATSDSLATLINQIEPGIAEHSHSWNEITGKPSEFPPEEHSHTAEEVGALPSTYTPPVTSVNGKTGDVVLDASDVKYTGQLGGSFDTAYEVNGYPLNKAIEHQATEISQLHQNVDLANVDLNSLWIEVGKKVTAFDSSITLLASAWGKTDSGVWTMGVDDLTLTGQEHLAVDVDPTDILENGGLTTENVAILKARVAAFSLIDFIVPASSGVLLICLNKPPSVDIPIILRVVV